MGGLVQKIIALGASGQRDVAETELAAAMERLPDQFEIYAAGARLSETRNDWQQAEERWRAVLARFPERVAALQGLLSALRNMRRFDEAEAVLNEEGVRFPASFELATTAAGLAMARQDWPAAEARLQAVRVGWPDRLNGYADGATLLRDRGRLDEAEALLQEAVTRFGETIGLLSQLAMICEARKDWEGAVTRWRSAARAAPSEALPQLNIMQTLVKLGRRDEADQLLAKVIVTFTESHEVARYLAVRAEGRKAWPEALFFWQRAASLEPGMLPYIAHTADALVRLERFEEADSLLRDTLLKHPNNTRLITSYARTAQARSDWPEAKLRWERLMKLDPNHGVATLQLGIVNYQLNALETDALSEEQDDKTLNKTVIRAARTFDVDFDKVRPIEGPMDTNRAFLRDMFMQMENIGDNCEFGLVQRRFGAEPLGLLRWTGTPIRSLAQAFDDDLEGIGLPENTRIALLSGDEYYTSDTRYGMRMHTFIFLGQAEPDTLLVKLCKRIQYLRRKLLDDLTAGNQKLFVYKSLFGYKSGEIELLHESLQRRGRNTLMCVKLADDTHPDGTVEQIAPTLLIGYIKRFNNDGGTWMNTEFDSWAAISTAAYRLWHAQLDLDAERADTPNYAA
jgi:tetratricopeptide (TPR) repeat protein